MTPGSLKLNINIKVRSRYQKLEAEAKGSRGRGRGQNFGLEALTSLQNEGGHGPLLRYCVLLEGVRMSYVKERACECMRTQQAVQEAATICPAPVILTFDLLTLKVVSESRVTWATSVSILAFLGLSVLDLGPMYASDRQTDVRQHHRLMPIISYTKKGAFSRSGTPFCSKH